MDTDEPVGEWLGGKCLGTIIARKNKHGNITSYQFNQTLTMRKKTLYTHTQSFSVKDHDSIEATLAAAEEYRREFCIDTQTIFNRYRFTEEGHVELEVAFRLQSAPYHAKLDRTDLERVKQHTWHMTRTKAITYIKSKKRELGAYVLDCPNKNVLYRNNDPLDCRRCNIKYVKKRGSRSSGAKRSPPVWDEKRQRVQVRWTDSQGRRKSKIYSAKKYGSKERAMICALAKSEKVAPQKKRFVLKINQPAWNYNK